MPLASGVSLAVDISCLKSRLKRAIYRLPEVWTWRFSPREQFKISHRSQDSSQAAAEVAPPACRGVKRAQKS